MVCRDWHRKQIKVGIFFFRLLRNILPEQIVLQLQSFTNKAFWVLRLILVNLFFKQSFELVHRQLLSQSHFIQVEVVENRSGQDERSTN